MAAVTAFRDDLSISFPDPEHSLEEEPSITVGVSSQKRLLMVAHTEQGDLIRTISARELTRRDDELGSEYDLSGLLKGGGRGKYADRYPEGTNPILLASDVAAVFPDKNTVNQALRLVMQLARIPRPGSHGVVEP